MAESTKITGNQYSIYGDKIEHFVNAVHDSNVVLTPTSGGFTITETVLGGLTLQSNKAQKILFSNQTNASENLVFVVLNSVAGGFKIALDTTYDNFGAFNNTIFQSFEGTFAGCLHQTTTTDPFTPLTTPLTVTRIKTRIELLEDGGGGGGGGTWGSIIGTLADQTDLQADLDAKQNLTATPTNGNILTTDAAGQSVDSGKLFNDLGTTTNDILSASEVDTRIATAVQVESVFGRSGVVVATSGDYSSDLITYDNTLSGLTATNVKLGVDELKTITDGKLTSTLTDSNIFVGDALNSATGVAVTGDIAITNTGVTTIQTDAVTTTKLLDANITNAKLSQAPANTYKGNDTGALGVVVDVATNTAFNKNYETTPANILSNGTASVGILDTIARADHIHPQDALKSDKILNSLDIADLPTGGDIGLATATVDVYERFDITQTTASQTITLPAPTLATDEKIVYVSNIGTVNFFLYGAELQPNRHISLIYDATAGWIVDYYPTSLSVPDFVGATDLLDGASGGVPQPLAGEETRFLKGDGTWGVPNEAPQFYGFKVENRDLIYEFDIVSANLKDYIEYSFDPMGFTYSVDVNGNLIATY
jgi:hypothetical protein